ncbi:hypothetical protein C7999DRAFT_17508, partial [Corynascus novoguineensis]
CNIARNVCGLEYAWVGTRCIDKASNAELSEAIKPMLSWYKTAAIYPVYLPDFTTIRDHLGAYRWPTRDWTLQELIAPHGVTFYDRKWFQSGQRRVLSKLWPSGHTPWAALLSQEAVTSYRIRLMSRPAIFDRTLERRGCPQSKGWTYSTTTRLSGARDALEP